jgi:chromodomain-helicase-DNA-binding protein 3
MPPKSADDFVSSPSVKYSYYNLEWLVKWRGLGYDHATWELETLPCLCTPEADELKKNYESRHEAAKRSSVPGKLILMLYLVLLILFEFMYDASLMGNIAWPV